MSRTRFQFSLFRLLVAVAIIGSLLACFVNFGLSLAMLTLVWSVLLISLAVAPLLAWWGNDSRRAFWGGVAWFGWIYVLLLWAGRVPLAGNHVSVAHVVRLPALAVDLGTRAIYDWTVPRESRMWSDDPTSEFGDLAANYNSQRVTPLPPGAVPPGGFVAGLAPPAGLPGGFGGMAPPVAAAPPPNPPRPRLLLPWELFRDLAHAVWAILWSLLGGVIAWRLSRRREIANPQAR